MPLTEQQALSDILKSPEQGGGTTPGGSLGAGADVPAVLDQDPATRQLLQEAIYTRTGQSKKAQESSQAFNKPADVATNTTGVTSSAEADTQFNDNVNKLDTLKADASADLTSRLSSTIPELDSSTANFDEQDRLIDNVRARNKEDLAVQIENIKSGFAARRQEQAATNKGRQGATRNLLAATGASTFASGKGAMTAEIQRGQDAINELTALENQAIQAAQMAANNQDVTLLQKSIENAEAARKAKNEVRQQIFENYLAMQQESRSQGEYGKSAAASTLNSIGTLSPESIKGLDPVQLKAIESQAGLPDGFMDAFVATQEAMGTAKTEADAFEKSSKLLEMALKLPSGTEFNINGNTVKGLDAGNNKIFQSSDGRGNVTFTTVDSAKGTVVGFQTLANIGGVTGSASGGGGRGGSGGGLSSTGLTTEQQALFNEAVKKVGSEITLDNGTKYKITTQDVYQDFLSDPAFGNDKKFMDTIENRLSDFNALGPKANYVTTTVNDAPAVMTVVDGVPVKIETTEGVDNRLNKTNEPTSKNNVKDTWMYKQQEWLANKLGIKF